MPARPPARPGRARGAILPAVRFPRGPSQSQPPGPLPIIAFRRVASTGLGHRRWALLIAALAAFTPAAVSAQAVTLSARVGGTTVRLDGDPAPGPLEPRRPDLWDALSWRIASPGLSWTELELAAGSLRTPVRAIAVHLDPHRHALRLEWATAANGMTGAWTVDDAASPIALALNAGQFKETGPWGWVVMDGVERRDPGIGPLSVGIALTDSGAVHWLRAGELHEARSDPRIVHAFQTYPLLLFDGQVPALALDPSRVEQTHRDARLILAERPDGTLLIVLTRFAALGPAAERVPIGLTLPESIVLMEALGARHAAMLDGGISAQLLVRAGDGTAHVWRGLRAVPLALVATPR